MAELSYDELERIAVSYPIKQEYIKPLNPRCKTNISSQFSIPEIVLDTFLKTESGYSGHIRKNSNQTWDVGPMQINSIHWKFFYNKFNVSPIDLRFNGCMNLLAGAYLIRGHLDSYGYNKIDSWNTFFQVAANYHSKTPKLNKVYQKKWIRNFKELIEQRSHEKPF